MHAVWSWDNCFNALGVAAQDPALSWEQLMLLIDQQNEQGAFPDFVTDDCLEWGFVKPPIHGWALRKLMHYPWVDKKHLQEIYEPLCKATHWWFRWRDMDGDGIPEYLHGNDSGWDNCTLFDVGYPVKSPDLMAFLAIQMEVLGEVADRLGKDEEAAQWKRKSKEAIRILVDEFWDGTRFVAKSMDGKTLKSPSSLLSYLPIILAERLPENIVKTMAADLKTEGYLLTKFGLASESPKSKRFIADGYWRGAIWAPPIAIIVDGLNDSGETALARKIARRFCDMCAKSGFAENYHALTGKSLRDPGYTWTSSIFLLLASGDLWNKSLKN
jgi:glycogen debranching enzyme